MQGNLTDLALVLYAETLKCWHYTYTDLISSRETKKGAYLEVSKLVSCESC